MSTPHDASGADSSANSRRNRRRLRAEEHPTSADPGSAAPNQVEAALHVSSTPAGQGPRNPRRGFPLNLDGSSRRKAGSSGDPGRQSLLHTMTGSIKMLDPKTAALDARAEQHHEPQRFEGGQSAEPPRATAMKGPASTPVRGITRPARQPDTGSGPEADFFAPRLPSDATEATAPSTGLSRPQSPPQPSSPGYDQPTSPHSDQQSRTAQPGADPVGLSRPDLPAQAGVPAPASDPHKAATPAGPDHSFDNPVPAAPAQLSRSERRSAESQAKDEVTQKAGRNLPLAILMGVVLGGMTLLALQLQPVAFLAIATLAGIWAMWELAFAVAKAKIYTPILPLVVSGIGIPVAAFAGGVSALSVAFFLACIAVVLWSALDDTARGRYDVAGSIFIVSYVPLMLGLAMLMLTSTMGQQKVITFIAVTVASDIGGYAFGRLFGKHPIAPMVSPKKTWEGLAGSMGSSALIGALLAATLLGQPFWMGAILGAGAALAATVGDMSQSLIKRDVGVKDMGSGIPGHGGMMERLDSLLVVAPLAYGLFRLWIP